MAETSKKGLQSLEDGTRLKELRRHRRHRFSLRWRFLTTHSADSEQSGRQLFSRSRASLASDSNKTKSFDEVALHHSDSDTKLLAANSGSTGVDEHDESKMTSTRISADEKFPKSGPTSIIHHDSAAIIDNPKSPAGVSMRPSHSVNDAPLADHANSCSITQAVSMSALPGSERAACMPESPTGTADAETPVVAGDADQTEKALQRRRAKRMHLLLELLDTEDSYVKHLAYLVEDYMQTIPTIEDRPEALKGDEHRRVFGNIQQIFEFHRDIFLPAIQKFEPQAADETPENASESGHDLSDQLAESLEQLAYVFIRYERRLEFMYVKYCENKPESEQVVSLCSDGFFDELRVRFGHKLAINDLLIKPVQRITKYQLLLSDLLKCAKAIGAECSQQQRAVSVMCRVPMKANNIMNFARMRGYNDKRILSYATLELQDTFLVHDASDNRPRRSKVFLFNQVLIFSDVVDRNTMTGGGSSTQTSPMGSGYLNTSREMFLYRSQIKMNQLRLRAQDSDGFTVSDQSNATHFRIECRESDVRHRWISTILRMLQMQTDFVSAIQSPIHHQNQLAQGSPMDSSSVTASLLSPRCERRHNSPITGTGTNEHEKIMLTQSFSGQAPPNAAETIPSNKEAFPMKDESSPVNRSSSCSATGKRSFLAQSESPSPKSSVFRNLGTSALSSATSSEAVKRSSSRSPDKSKMTIKTDKTAVQPTGKARITRLKSLQPRKKPTRFLERLFGGTKSAHRDASPETQNCTNLTSNEQNETATRSSTTEAVCIPPDTRGRLVKDFQCDNGTLLPKSSEVLVLDVSNKHAFVQLMFQTVGTGEMAQRHMTAWVPISVLDCKSVLKRAKRKNRRFTMWGGPTPQGNGDHSQQLSSERAAAGDSSRPMREPELGGSLAEGDTVGSRPEFVEPLPARVDVESGDAVVLTCRVRTGQAKLRINWSGPNGAVSADDNALECSFSSTGVASLKIKETTADRSGPYTCEVLNSVGRSTSTTLLHVHFPTKWKSSYGVQYRQMELLARGVFSHVYKCVDRSTGQSFAAKRRVKKTAGGSRLEHEYSCLQQLQATSSSFTHAAHLVTAVDLFETEADFVMILALVSNTLYDFLTVGPSYSLSTVKLLLSQLLGALHFMHGQHLAHLNIKPENLMVERNEVQVSLKLVGFGRTRLISPSANFTNIPSKKSDIVALPVENVSDPEFSPPEAFAQPNQPLDFAADTWDVAVTCFVLLTGFSPFYERASTVGAIAQSESELRRRIAERVVSANFSQTALDPFPMSVRDFVRSVLIESQPAQRKTIDDCLKHAWLTSETPDVSLSSSRLLEFISRRNRSLHSYSS